MTALARNESELVVQDLSAMRTLGVEGGPALLVVGPPDEFGDLSCDGVPMANRGASPCSLAAWSKGSIRLGQRLTDSASRLTVVCTLAGDGVLTFSGRPLEPVDHVPPSIPISATGGRSQPSKKQKEES
jgi:hypothetical protein